MKCITSVACDTYLPMQKHIAHTIPPIAMMIPKIITVTYSILQSAKNPRNLSNNNENHFLYKHNLARHAISRNAHLDYKRKDVS